MEASITGPRGLEGDKAQRIIAAVRASVASRGAAASTFDHVAREAGVSRGLLHYYFGSKERLLVEVVRQDCDDRIRAMDERLAGARSADEVMQALLIGLAEFLGEPSSQAVIYEMLSASRHSEEIRAELAELYRRFREHMAIALREKEREGIVKLEAEPEAVASMLLALGDGFGIQVITDPDWNRDAAFELGVRLARGMLGAGPPAAPAARQRSRP
jgi:AcrR family transcriptional regulator